MIFFIETKIHKRFLLSKNRTINTYWQAISKRNHTNVDSTFGQLKMIDGQIWHVFGHSVDLYSTDLEKLRTIKLSDISRITDLVEMKGDLVTVACYKGLFPIDKQGK